MAKINKVGHVVLGCRDPQASIKFYTENLGMELVQFNHEFQMAFFSFGERDHDIESIGLLAGQSVGLVHEIKPAALIIRDLVEGARQLIEQRLTPALVGRQA